ncbi:MAG TPA: efflux RND transporter periplasmic adaptor subunit [Opitutales bacterium]|jgi:HlyD family secretion protein|nr:efflux RND transporter periplasmic adaptor subunit [Opitutales bacterium]
MKRFWIILVLALVAACALGGYWWIHRAAASDNSYVTSAIARGDVQELIPATGTIEPEESVDIGAQVSGIIKTLWDPKTPDKVIDFRSVVKKDDIIATIDDTIYQADLDSAKAQLDSANANVESAKANLEEDQVKLTDAAADWDRAQKLGSGEALAQTTYDSYKATYETAKAQVDVGTAAISQAQAAVKEAQAQVDSANRNLGYCTITSPVNGTVIDRRLDQGQTVVSSLNAPSLFLIASDLSKLKIWVSVNEADVPRIKEGMPVLFDVDGINHQFQGTVNKVRWNATMTQNVVTYTVEVDADNPDGTLIPYRTTNVKFLVNESKGVVMVPNAALRWRPKNFDMSTITPMAGTASSAGTSAAPADSGSTGSAAGSGGTSRGGKGSGAGKGGAAKAKQSVVFVLENGAPKAVPVQTGITDEVNTAILGGDLKEGDQVITGQATADQSANSGTTNPFAPNFARGGGGGGGRGAGGG